MTEIQPIPKPRSRPWILSLLALIGMVGVWFLPSSVGAIGKITYPDWVRFIGHFHPVILHLPIGVFTLIVAQELWAIFRKSSDDSAQTAIFPYLFGALTAAASVLTGMLLYAGSGDDYLGNPTAERHMWLGLAFTSGAFLTLLLKAWAEAVAANPAFYRSALFLCVASMSLAGHDGGTMTHGEGFLTRYAPEPLRRMLGLEIKGKIEKTTPAVKEELVAFNHLISPILERRCVQCHKAEKSKGRLRMDTYELLLKGGKEGPAIVAGDASNSLIIQRIQLPMDDEEHMPPEGKPDITDDELKVLTWWINSGADPHALLSSLSTPPDVAQAIEKISQIAPSASDEKSDSAPQVDSTNDARAKLQVEMQNVSKDFPGALLFESQVSPALTFTAVSYRQTFDDAALARLEPFLSHLVSIDLSSAKITDRGIEMLDERAASLVKLNLAQTAVSDAALEIIRKLPALESLNLFGTAITDEGISKIESMPTLKNLYLGETAVTPQAMQTLRQKMPHCQVHGGID